MNKAQKCFSAVSVFAALSMSLVSSAWSASAAASDWRSDRNYGGGGHTVPSPLLSDSNSKVELADGEIYTIAGKVGFDHGQPYLKVDLERMPWLATAARKASPYYILEGAPSYWKSYENDYVKYTCEAHGNVVDVKGSLEYVITLGSIEGGKVQIVRDCGRSGGHHCGE